ncbi:phosphoribosylformylglycinamidine synthase [Candidatus Micrarchaeota archaeon]|nr:phosphoribosylformylglycinamidine synthase [Candidatus Micrarchaeota archaeon]
MVAHRIEVAYRLDSRIAQRTAGLKALGFKVENVRLVDVYTLSRDFSRKQLGKIGSILANPVFQDFTVDKATQTDFDFAVEVGFLPGVTDNVGTTAQEMIEDALKAKFKPGEAVHSSQLFLFDGDSKQAKAIGLELANPLIQRIHAKTRQGYGQAGMDVVVPKVKLDELLKAERVDLELDDEALAELGKKGILDPKTGVRRGPLALDLPYLHAIRDYFLKQGRKPTDVELESLAQTWSEHCKHTIFAAAMDDDVPEGLYKTYIQGATRAVRKKKGKNDFCVSVFSDNSGAIVFDEEFLVTHKVETHNSPSALDPFGGAITGIVGVNRDTIGFGLGAKPAINVYGFCFGNPQSKPQLYRGKNKADPAIAPRRVMEGVVRGVNAGGNQSGIPTPQGFCYFDDRYAGKPLVFVGTVGVMPCKINGRKLYVKKAEPGDVIVMVGGRVGKDGIHGATFSSEAMDFGSPATSVQIGDPITQKKLSDALVKEARDLGLYHSITDNGAGGLSCSVAEMAKECNGCFVELDKVPLKYPGMAPWEIWISESQERMTVAVPQEKLEAFMDLMQRRGVEATAIGSFTNSGRCVVAYHGETVMDVGLGFLHDGLPKKHLHSTFKPLKHPEPKPSAKKDFGKTLLSMLSRKNIASTEFVSTQYDHAVQGGLVVGPLQGKGRVQGQASLTKVVLGSKKAVALSQATYPRYSDIDAYHMACAGIDSAIRNLVALGADPEKIALLDNFCWCSSNEPTRLGQLKRAVKACYDAATAFEAPFISGKDSMFNDFLGFDGKNNPVKISIPPTLLVSSMAVVDDAEKAVTLDSKVDGDTVYVVGPTKNETGGSEYFAWLGYLGNRVPEVDFAANKKRYERFHQAVQKGLVASAYPLGLGGLGVALAKTAIAGKLGLDLDVQTGLKPDEWLFSESQGRLLVTLDPKNVEAFEKIMGSDAVKIGKVGGTRLRVNDWLDVGVDALESAYKQVFSHGG